MFHIIEKHTINSYCVKQWGFSNLINFHAAQVGLLNFFFFFKQVMTGYPGNCIFQINFCSAAFSLQAVLLWQPKLWTRRRGKGERKKERKKEMKCRRQLVWRCPQFGHRTGVELSLNCVLLLYSAWTVCSTACACARACVPLCVCVCACMRACVRARALCLCAYVWAFKNANILFPQGTKKSST